MKHNGIYNATATKIKNGADFVAWLKTIKPEYHDSIKSHRRTVIALVTKARAK